ncbi:MAG: ABC transporter ATP-binding protein [Deltaproteobacteria bacterium]|jgi:ABC-2 type transport system ATP-binding protein|nr:ABC transporter ATP-binding protein [Deltaproteobacteria bacterium]
MTKKAKKKPTGDMTTAKIAGEAAKTVAPGVPSESGAANNRPFVAIEALDVFFGDYQALININLTLNRGDRTALLGPNGAGKSTLIKAVCGALNPSGGRVLVDGKDPRLAKADPALLGWLPEGAPLNPELTVLEHLRLTCRLRNLNEAEGRREMERLIEGLNLANKLNRLAGGLSMGSRRQAALALALLGQPKLIVLDEPTSSLDPAEARRFAELLTTLGPDTTMIISSHILGEVSGVTEAAIFLNQGSLAGQGRWENLPGGSDAPHEAYFELVRHE